MGTPYRPVSGDRAFEGGDRPPLPVPPTRRLAPAFAALVLAALAALTLAGCRRPGPTPASAPLPGKASVREAREFDAATLDALSGRLVVLTLDEEGQRNRAMELDRATGRWRELWATSSMGNVSDWRPSPDGRSAVYRIIQRSSAEDAVEALVLRGLGSAAQPRTLVVVDASRARLAGFAWAPDGGHIAYGLQELPASSGTGAAWSLREVAIAAVDGSALAPPGEGGGAADGGASGAPGDPNGGRLLWQAPQAPDQPLALALEAYDPARGRAVVSALAADSGIVAALRRIDLAAGQVIDSVPVTLAGLAPAVGPGGLLALAEGAPLAEQLRLLGLAEGLAPRELFRAPAGASLGRPLWSADGRRLTLPVYPDAAADAAEPDSLILVFDPGGSQPEPVARFTVPGSLAAPLAFSPDGRWLLAQAGGPEEAFGARLLLLPSEGGAPLPAPFAAPPGSWALSWLP